jgi:uncharacterized protein (DUF983 family)
MPRAYFDEDEGPGEHDAHLLDDHDGNDMSPCPRCGRAILAWADRCHHCGEHLGREAWLAERPGRRGVWLIAAGLVIFAMLWFLLR